MDDYNRADTKLLQFVTQFEKLYGVENMVYKYNVHLIQHLAKCVKECGPLWSYTYSNFNFEHNNGVLVSYVNGTTDMEKQIVLKYLYQKSININTRKDVVAYLDYISTLRKVKHVRCIGNVTLLNKPILRNLTDEEKLALRDYIVISSAQCNEYKKFIINNDIYYSSSYKRAKQTNDTCVKLIDGSYCQIDSIIQISEVVYLLVTIFDPVRESNIDGINEDSHLKICMISSATKKCVVTTSVLKKCIFVSTNNLIVITELPNKIECD